MAGIPNIDVSVKKAFPFNCFYITILWLSHVWAILCMTWPHCLNNIETKIGRFLYRFGQNYESKVILNTEVTGFSTVHRTLKTNHFRTNSLYDGLITWKWSTTNSINEVSPGRQELINITNKFQSEVLHIVALETSCWFETDFFCRILRGGRHIRSIHKKRSSKAVKRALFEVKTKIPWH